MLSEIGIVGSAAQSCEETFASISSIRGDPLNRGLSKELLPIWNDAQ